MTPIRLRVRELREAKGMTQAQLAKRAMLRPATVNRIEREDDPPASIELRVLERLANALGVDAALLIVHERG